MCCSHPVLRRNALWLLPTPPPHLAPYPSNSAPTASISQPQPRPLLTANQPHNLAPTTATNEDYSNTNRHQVPTEHQPTTNTTRWERPGILPVSGESERAARRAEAERILRRVEAAKNRGEDYALPDILALRSACMAAGGASLETRTVGARDAIYKAAVEAGIKSCLEPGVVDLGGYSPLRLAAGVASDVSLPERRAVSTLCGAVAGACRARIVEVGIRMFAACAWFASR